MEPVLNDGIDTEAAFGDLSNLCKHKIRSYDSSCMVQSKVKIILNQKEEEDDY